MNLHIRNLNDPDVKVPHPDLDALQQLWAVNQPFDHAGTEHLFVNAVRQCTQYHYDRNSFYKIWLDQNCFTPKSIQTIKDIEKIPFIHANFYKTHVVKTAKDEDIVLHLTSSGTTGQKSQMFYDDWTIFSSDKSADVQFEYYGWITDEPTNFLLYSYEPAINANVGTLRTRQMMRRYAKENELMYALKYTGKGHEFDLFGCIQSLLKFEKEGLPVRLLGFPAFLYFTLERMKDMGYPPLQLNPKSLVMMGGGWKGFVDKQLTPPEFRAYIKERLGLPETCCHESYGAVEHGVAYIDCPNHHFHVPVYSRALIRDVRTLEVLPLGNAGFMNVISPMNTTVPVVSLLLGDMVVMHDGKKCGCGVETPYFEIMGRAGTSKNKSCAIAAAELLKKK
jgi:phenylacetate-coenzyme A ligase PaaK-like adenylate-forming protein